MGCKWVITLMHVTVGVWIPMRARIMGAMLEVTYLRMRFVQKLRKQQFRSQYSKCQHWAVRQRRAGPRWVAVAEGPVR